MESRVQGSSSPALIDQTIGANLRATVGRHAEREALVSCAQGLRQTYAELDAAVDDVTRALLAAGIGKGDRVGLWSPNCAEWTHLQFATARAGAILVNLNPAYRTHELAYALQQSGTRLLVSARSFKSSDYAAMVDEVRDDVPDLERVVWIGHPA
jgi:fatty-acyl-CoA synthase